MNNIEQLNNILTKFKIAANCKHFGQYKNAFYYDIVLNPGTRINSIVKYTKEISLALKAPSEPEIKILPDEGLVRLEYIIVNNSPVKLFDLAKNAIRPSGSLQCLLGETIHGDSLWFDVAQAPHTLIGGTTGSGKTTLLHSILANLMVHDNTNITLMDPKGVEFGGYNQFSNVEAVFDYKDCLSIVNAICGEMDKRYAMMKEHNITANHFPRHVLVIDEFADLIMQDSSKQFYSALCRLAQKSRSAGIHIILATQRPSATIIDGAIKANFPARIACRTASGIDSKIILDSTGAEDLYGKGDAIIKCEGLNYQRFKVAYTTFEEIEEYFGDK